MGLDDGQEFQDGLREILAASNRIEEALERAGSQDLSERLRGWLALADLESSWKAIAEHCQLSKSEAESSFRDELNGAELLCMSSEHTEIQTLLRGFRQEMESATAGAAAAILPLGRSLVRQIRAHARNEGKVLEHIARPEPVTEELLLRYSESPD